MEVQSTKRMPKPRLVCLISGVCATCYIAVQRDPVAFEQFIAELLIWLGRVMPASFLLVLPLGGNRVASGALNTRVRALPEFVADARV